MIPPAISRHLWQHNIVQSEWKHNDVYGGLYDFTKRIFGFCCSTIFFSPCPVGFCILGDIISVVLLLVDLLSAFIVVDRYIRRTWDLSERRRRMANWRPKPPEMVRRKMGNAPNNNSNAPQRAQKPHFVDRQHEPNAIRFCFDSALFRPSTMWARR